MLDYNKYISGINGSDIFELTCPHCGAVTHSAKGKSVFCNFCEQYINITDAAITKEAGAEVAFAQISGSLSAGRYEDAENRVAQLVKGTEDPKLNYMSAISYLYLSDARYHDRDYNLRGFMEKNADNVRESLELISKSKEHFYKAIKLVRYELDRDVMVDESTLFIKFISEIRLKRFVDSSKTLRLLRGSGAQSLIGEYADMVYYVEADRVVAEEVLPSLLSRNEINAFYYLAKHLATKKRLDEAEKVLKWLSGITNMMMAQELLRKIHSAQEASKF